MFYVVQEHVWGRIVMATEAPRWISWALGDLVVKVVVGVVLLLPYGALMNVLKPMPQVTAR